MKDGQSKNWHDLRAVYTKSVNFFSLDVRDERAIIYPKTGKKEN